MTNFFCCLVGIGGSGTPPRSPPLVHTWLNYVVQQHSESPGLCVQRLFYVPWEYRLKLQTTTVYDIFIIVDFTAIFDSSTADENGDISLKYIQARRHWGGRGGNAPQ